MMKFTKTMLLTAMVLPLTLGSASSFAAEMHHDKHQHQQHHHEGKWAKHSSERSIFKQLNLTDKQKEQIKQIRQQARQEMLAPKPYKAKKKSYYDLIKPLLMADKFDAEQAGVLAKEMAEQQAQKQVKMLDLQHKVLHVLTQEQREKYFQLKEDRMVQWQLKQHERMQKQAEKK